MSNIFKISNLRTSPLLPSYVVIDHDDPPKKKPILNEVDHADEKYKGFPLFPSSRSKSLEIPSKFDHRSESENTRILARADLRIWYLSSSIVQWFSSILFGFR